MLRNEDRRSKKIVFISNCLLNANNKVQEFARYPGMLTEVVRVLDLYGIGVMQMPCPEVLYSGCQRWWSDRTIYNNAGYRHFCRKLSEQTVDYLENYSIAGYDVIAFLVCDGSPTCGLTVSSHYENGGGHPEEPLRSLREVPGVYTEELLSAIQERGLNAPPMYGLRLDDKEAKTTDIIANFKKFIEKRMEECRMKSERRI